MKSFVPESPEWNPSAKLYSKSLGHHPSCVAEATVVRHLMTERKKEEHMNGCPECSSNCDSSVRGRHLRTCLSWQPWLLAKSCRLAVGELISALSLRPLECTLVAVLSDWRVACSIPWSILPCERANFDIQHHRLLYHVADEMEISFLFFKAQWGAGFVLLRSFPLPQVWLYINSSRSKCTYTHADTHLLSIAGQHSDKLHGACHIPWDLSLCLFLIICELGLPVNKSHVKINRINIYKVLEYYRTQIATICHLVPFYSYFFASGTWALGFLLIFGTRDLI